MENDVTGPAGWINELMGRDVKHTPGDPCADGTGDCAEVRDNASDFIDGEVTPTLTMRIRHHLGLCSDCDPWFTSVAQTVGLMRSAPQEDVPASLREKIRQISDE